MFGFLNVYKPKGITSHDVISRLRRVFNLRQIGHAGTLDPFAEGVLPVAVGKATRLLEYLSDDKAYIATVQFGAVTDTYDIEGEIISQSEKKITSSDIENILPRFQGEIEQTPPIYSAIKVNGKKLYEYAREGKEIEVKTRRVTVFEIKLVSFDEETQTAEVYCKCSKGTYIRSIGYDIGQILGCGAYLSGLKRVLSSGMDVASAIQLDEITPQTNLITPEKVIDIPMMEINDIELERVLHGLAIYPNGREVEGSIGFLHNGKFIGTGEVVENKIKVKKVVCA